MKREYFDKDVNWEYLKKRVAVIGYNSQARVREILDALMKPIEQHQIEIVGRFVNKAAGIEK
jgi:hypothetical protein